jgi:hypothetical protein
MFLPVFLSEVGYPVSYQVVMTLLEPYIKDGSGLCLVYNSW